MRYRYREHLIRGICLLGVVQLAACSSVEAVAPFDRGYLAEDGMQWEENSRNAKLKAFNLALREFSSHCMPSSARYPRSKGATASTLLQAASCTTPRRQIPLIKCSRYLYLIPVRHFFALAWRPSHVITWLGRHARAKK